MPRAAAFLFSLLLLAALPARAAPACGENLEPCAVPNGHYFVERPDDWDGQRPLPVLVHFHGYREQASEIIAREDIRAIAARLGILIVVPQGEGQTWSHPGSPSQLRDEFAFVEAMLADLRQRFRIDESRLWASGFSQGASMLWTVACQRSATFRFYLPISGVFWRPEPESCSSPPPAIRHVHGLRDVTFPLEGRPVRGGKFHQGRADHAIRLMREAGACHPEPQDDVTTRGVLSCRVAQGCRDGQFLEFCLHAGGHDFDPSWIEDSLRPLLRNSGETALKR